MDVERLERAIASTTFLERRGSFRSAWQAGSQTIAPHLLEGESRPAGATLQLPRSTQ